MNATTKMPQIEVSRSSAAYWRVTFNNPPLNVMGPNSFWNCRNIMSALEASEELKVVVFASAVEGFFLESQRFPRQARGFDRHTSGAHGAGGVA